VRVALALSLHLSLEVRQGLVEAVVVVARLTVIPVVAAALLVDTVAVAVAVAVEQPSRAATVPKAL
jgi:hypothetical protein